MTSNRDIKIVVEKHPDGFVAYPLGIEGVVIGQGETYEEALNDVTSAIIFHIETFGESVLGTESPFWRRSRQNTLSRVCIEQRR